MLALIISKLIFLSINIISHIITKAILSSAAYLVVLLIQGFKEQAGEHTKGVLEQGTDSLRTVFEKLFGLIMEGISTLLSSLLNAIINGIVDTVVSESSAVGELILLIKNVFEDLLNNVVDYEIIHGFVQMVSTLVFDVLNNCIEALGYVNKNV